MNFDIETLKQRLAGDTDLIRVLLDDALGQVPEDLDRLGAFLDAGQSVEALHQAHRLKGIALNLCFSALATLSTDLEEGLQTHGVVPGALAKFAALRAAWTDLEGELRPRA